MRTLKGSSGINGSKFGIKSNGRGGQPIANRVRGSRMGPKLVFAALALVVATSVGFACGPFFPWQLLDDRAATLKATPNNSFAWEAAHLLTVPADAPRAFEPGFNAPDEEQDNARIKAETEGLTEARQALLGQIRAAADDASAMALAKGLPADIGLYTVGAADYRRGDTDNAAAHFRAVLALPDPAHNSRATWAAYMLGRIAADAGHVGAAAAAFARTRALAADGAPDPLALGVASYGEEARLHLKASHGRAFDAAYGQEIAAAVGLYARQAALGSRIAVESLRMVAEMLLGRDDPPTGAAALPAAIADPTVQRLLVAYALARIEDDLPGAGANPLLVRLVAAIEAKGLNRPAGADRLAALCYRVGRFDLADKLASAAEGPLAAWVKAKLALHRGDMDTAAAQYAEASRAFPDVPLDEANRALLQGERGTLSLARGDYVGALTQLYPVAATYWGDVAHIAERVLTVDELKTFVDAHAGGEAPHPAGDADIVLINDPQAQLRALLARRLVRTGRFEDALAYFPAAADPPVRDWVRSYAQAMHDTTARWWAVDRAKAWFDASAIAREHGMEIMAMEGPPDRFVVDGNYACCVGQAKLEGPFITEGEKTRFAASVAQPDKRYHYRYVAVLDASRAADLLPPRSQAFAAVLCSATGFVLNQDRAAATVLYARYLRAGAYVPWAAHFGADCPAPDFAAAASFPREQAARDTRRFVSRYRWLVGGGMAVLLVVGVLAVRRTRRVAAGV